VFDLSVVICSHNPRADHFHRTLNSLKEQVLPLGKWELILVDNASAHPLAATWDLSWHPHGRHVAESKLGLSVARQRGMREAVSDLLVFVDDDNVLDKTYLLNAVAVSHNWPLLGVWGSGAIIPEFESQPSKYLYRNNLSSYLALVENKRPFWANSPSCGEAIPLGAGFCVRKSVASAYLENCSTSTIVISDRRGTALQGGGDIEISFVACEMGLGIGVFPQLRLVHLISKDRVSPRYLLRIYEGAQTSDTLLAYKWRGVLPRSPFHPRGLLSILKNMIVRRGFDLQMYFAAVRAAIAARRIIARSQTRRNSAKF
jgi:glycosyltransferase involved in cell wall biosynthesis